MELTDQEHKHLDACIATLELNTLKTMVTLTALEKGKDRSGNAIAQGKDMIGENLRAITEIRAILGIPLESKEKRGGQ